MAFLPQTQSQIGTQHLVKIYFHQVFLGLARNEGGLIDERLCLWNGSFYTFGRNFWIRLCVSIQILASSQLI